MNIVKLLFLVLIKIPVLLLSVLIAYPYYWLQFRLKKLHRRIVFKAMRK